MFDSNQRDALLASVSSRQNDMADDLRDIRDCVVSLTGNGHDPERGRVGRLESGHKQHATDISGLRNDFSNFKHEFTLQFKEQADKMKWTAYKTGAAIGLMLITMNGIEHANGVATYVKAALELLK
jgi:hypothetical protein